MEKQKDIYIRIYQLYVSNLQCSTSVTMKCSSSEFISETGQGGGRKRLNEKSIFIIKVVFV